MKHFHAGSDGHQPGPGPVIAVDIGGTRCRAAIADGTATLRWRRSGPTDQRGPEAFTGSVAAVVGDTLAAAAEDGVETAGLSVVAGATGPIGADGELVDPPNLHPSLRGLPLRARLEAVLRRPVDVGLDTHLALLGERAAGALRGTADGLFITVSTGVGGAVLANGGLVRGALGMAGEVGHLPVTAGGPRCGCGERGHLEAWASGPGIAARAAARAQARPGSPLAGRVRGLGRQVDGADVAAWTAAGDADAAAVLAGARRALAAAVVALAAVLDPAVVVLGGGVVLGDPGPWLDACRRRVLAHALEGQRGRIRIEVAALGDDAGLHGAPAYAALAGTGPASGATARDEA